MRMRAHVYQHLILLVLGLFNVTGSPSASASASLSSPTFSSRTTRHVYDINYRHIPRQLPVTTSSSYNYWWPYPSQTVAAPLAPIIPTSSTAALLLPFDAPSTSFTSPTTADTTTTTNSSSIPTLNSMITLTPHPPQTTSPIPSIKSLPKNDPKAQFKLTYILIPLFALLGVILGSITAWLVYGCLTRKPRVRQAFGEEDKVIGGPRYVPSEQDHTVRTRRAEADVEDGRYLGPMMHEADMECEEGMALFGWPSAPGVGEPEHGHGKGEDDLFLLPPSTQNNPRKSRSSKSTRSVMSNATSLAFLELYESDEEALDEEKRERRRQREEPWESLRHKSIKRGILEKVRKEAGWVDSLRGAVGSSFSHADRVVDTNEIEKQGNAKKRHTHVRGDSDLRIEDLLGVGITEKARTREVVKQGTGGGVDSYPKRPTLGSGVSGSASRANSSRTAYSSTSSDEKGFRILTESPLPLPLLPPPLHSRPSYASNDSWWGEASIDAHVDRYTAVPTRNRSRSTSQSTSRSTSPVKGAGAGGRRGSRRELDVLPQSPPRIMSPMLEDRLCFTPAPGRGWGGGGGGGGVGTLPTTPTPPWGWRSPSGVGEVVPTPKSRGKEKEKGRKLCSPRPPSLPLPFPRDPHRSFVNSPRQAEDVFRGRLVKPPVPSRKMAGLGRDKSLRKDGGDGALDKMGEIVKQRWSTRELRE